MNQKSLETKLGYKFKDAVLFKTALTHASAADARTSLKTYQRLEFLGDRVLGLAISDYLYTSHPTAEEGELSKRLTALVRKEACADRASAIQLGGHINLGSGEAQSGGREKPAILADVMEAVLGAIFLESGYAVAREIVLTLWKPLLETQYLSLQDAKTALQEWAHAQQFGNPVYEVKDKDGPDHNPQFTILVTVSPEHSSKGVGFSKREAEQAAASQMLKEIEIAAQ